MRDAVKDFIENIFINMVIPEPIYEFGACQYSEEYEGIKIFFPSKEYFGCDITPGRGVDKVLDLHNIEMPDNSIGSIIAVDTMEHVKYPHKAIDEIYRVLKDDGLVLITSVMDYEIHGAPNDYWRFTPDGFNVLLEKFPIKFVFYSGYDNFPSSVIIIASKSRNINMANLEMKINDWKEKWKEEKYDQYILQSRIHFLEEQVESYKRKTKENIFGKVKNEYNRFLNRNNKC